MLKQSDLNTHYKQGYIDARHDALKQVLDMYQKVCIAENAYINDLGGYNDNYNQRLFALEDVAMYLDVDGLNSCRAIKQAINQRTYTEVIDDKGRIDYKQIAGPREPEQAIL